MTVEELKEELYGWPENGGFQYDRLLEILVELYAKIKRLEQALDAAAGQE